MAVMFLTNEDKQELKKGIEAVDVKVKELIDTPTDSNIIIVRKPETSEG